MRLRNKSTGVVVNVSDEQAETMAANEWETVDRPAPEPVKPRRRKSAKRDDDEE